jgi:hypothetical protein
MPKKTLNRNELTGEELAAAERADAEAVRAATRVAIDEQREIAARENAKVTPVEIVKPKQ